MGPWYNLQASFWEEMNVIPEITWVPAFSEWILLNLSESNQLDLIMEAIKKKMQSLKSETDNALQRAEELDKEAKEATQRAEKYEENVSDISRKHFCKFG